jgi:hypothetical protein
VQENPSRCSVRDRPVSCQFSMRVNCTARWERLLLSIVESCTQVRRQFPCFANATITWKTLCQCLMSAPYDRQCGTNKEGPSGEYESRQPKYSEPSFRPKLQLPLVVTTGYFGDLAVTACSRFYCGGRVVEQLGVLGGHRINGPPSRAGTCWTAAARNVPTSPTIRIEILIVRFMGSSPPRRISPVGNFSADRHYKTPVKRSVQQFSSKRQARARGELLTP